MDIAFKPPVFLPLVLGGIVLVAVLASLLKKSSPARRITGIIVPVVVAAGLMIFLYRTTHLVADDTGIHTDTYGKQAVAWSQVTAARVVPDLAGSPYALTMRVGGTAIKENKSGWFKMASGATAFAVVEQSGKALVVEGDGKTFVLAPKAFDEFVAAVAKHVTVEQAGGAQ
jgi:hypothetical protein